MTDPATLRVTLASQSAARRQLLSAAGVTFDVESSGLDEDSIKAALLAEAFSPRDIADALAEGKAIKVSRRCRGLVIGADQTLDLDGKLFDKPVDLAQAREHLTALRGRSHTLHSAVVIARDGAPIWRYLASATLTMRPFSDAFLSAYLEKNAEAALSSVGGYQLEGAGIQLFSRIEGDYFAILGLPMLGLLDHLRLQGALAP
jgi:septum formation protein